MWFTKKDEAETPTAVAVMQSETAMAKPLPVPQSYESKPELDADGLEEYQKVCRAIGLLESGALTSERIRQCLNRENIRIFDSVKVAEFLNQKLGKWEWRGLRASDVEELAGWTAHHGTYRIAIGKRQYFGKVPLPVLLTVQRILEDVPEAHFYISHPIDAGDDPFLMVCTKDSNNFIVERWDEPDFRER